MTLSTLLYQLWQRLPLLLIAFLCIGTVYALPVKGNLPHPNPFGPLPSTLIQPEQNTGMPDVPDNRKTYETFILSIFDANYEPKDAVDAPESFLPGINRAGGPDNFGYRYTDSDEPQGPQFVWQDISASGTPITQWYSGSDDGYADAIPIGFAFPYYGVEKSNVYVTTNGFLSFDSLGSAANSNSVIPLAGAPNNIVAALWDDLDAGSGTVYYKQEPGKFILQYNNWSRYSSGGSLTFQIVLEQSGAIKFYYKTLTGVLDDCTIGIENAAGTDGLQVVYNASYLKDSLAVRFASAPIVSADTVYALSGDTVFVPINLEYFYSVGAITLKLNYNPSQLTFLGAENWSSVVSDALANGGNGLVTISWADPAGFSVESDKMVDLKFIYHTGTAPVTFDAANCEITDIYEAPLAIDYINGVVLPILLPPETPELVSPVNHQTGINPISLSAAWSSALRVEYYQLQVSLDSAFTSLVMSDSTFTGTSAPVTGITLGETYYWRVRALNRFGASAWSSVWDFTTIEGFSISGTVKYRNIAGTPINNAPITAKQSGTAVLSTVSNTSGAYSLNPLSPGTYTLSTSSDFPYGGVNSTDALFIRRYLINMKQLDALQLAAADVNNSSDVNSTDALLIRRRIVGLDSTFIRGTWVFEEPQVTIVDTSVTKNILGLLTGDVNASFSGSLQKDAPSVNSIAEGTITVEPGKPFSYPVLLRHSGSIAAVTLAFNYSDQDIVILSVSSPLNGFMYTANNGRLIIAWDDTEGFTLRENAPLLTIIAQAKDGAQLNNITVSPDFAFCEIADTEGEVIQGVTLVMPQAGLSLPSEFRLSQNFPNPFNPSTTIEYDVPYEGKVRIEIFNTLGEVVEVLADAVQAPGRYTAVWNAKNFTSGVYFYRMTAENSTKNFTQVKKLMLVK